MVPTGDIVDATVMSGAVQGGGGVMGKIVLVAGLK